MKKRTYFNDSVGTTFQLYQIYYNQLYELAISRFKWSGVPLSVDTRFLEVNLFNQGKAVFFRDEVLGFLALGCTANGPFDVYNNPIQRVAIASNDYRRELNREDSVLIYNNYNRCPSINVISNYAKRLANLDMSIDINVNAQKTPLLIVCDENERLTMLNMYQKYIGNEPVIFGTRALRADSLKILKTDSPYVADKLFYLRSMIWNDALAYLGIPNVPYQKRERLVSEEVNISSGGTVANRFGALDARQYACQQINAMFGLNISCDFREDLQLLTQIPVEQSEEVKT